MADSESTWRSTLQEVKRQALLHLKGSQDPSSAGSSDAEWVKVEGQPREAERCELWPQSQWQVAFEILLCQMPTSTQTLKPHQDDLLFFVSSEVPNGGIGSSTQGGVGAGAGGRPPLFVRRRARQLPGELAVGGARAGAVDWRASLLLNVVLQTGYCLSVATCRQDALPQLVEREGPGTGREGDGGCSPGSSAAGGPGCSIREVCQVVYASPSRVHVNLDASRSSSQAPEACYPDIAFAVEDFQHAFNSVVLGRPDDCYCVLLWAEARESWHLGGGSRQPERQPSHAAVPAPPLSATSAQASAALSAAAAPTSTATTDALTGQISGLQLTGESGSSSSGGGGLTAIPGGASLWPSGAGSGQPRSPPPQQQQQQPTGPKPRACPLVFSGFVSHQLLADALAPKLSGGGGLLGGGRGQRTSRVVMRGPGGLGGADVAVTSLPLAPSSPLAAAGVEEAPLPSSSPLNPFLSKASWLAKGVVEAAKKAAGGGKSEGLGPLQLRCALMTLVVPVDVLAASILEAL